MRTSKQVVLTFSGENLKYYNGLLDYTEKFTKHMGFSTIKPNKVATNIIINFIKNIHENE